MICPHPIPAVGAVIIEEGSLLLIRRGNEPGAGQWSIPGGRVELGEHLAEALQREVREETGLRIAVGAIADVSDLIVAEENAIAFHYVLIDYFAQVLDGDPRAGSDVTEVRWVPFADLDGYDLIPSMKPLLRQLGVLSET